jgi:hypothetical protein
MYDLWISYWLQLNLGPEKLRRKSCLSLIITAHFSFIIGADIAVGFQDQLMVSRMYPVCTVSAKTTFRMLSTERHSFMNAQLSCNSAFFQWYAGAASFQKQISLKSEY